MLPLSNTQEVQKFSSWPNPVARFDRSSSHAFLSLSSTCHLYSPFFFGDDADAGVVEHLSFSPPTFNSQPTLSPDKVKADKSSI